MFNGNCEAAFRRYRSIFGGEFQFLGRYKDAPKQNGKLFPESNAERIMHVSLPISQETILMGADHIHNHDPAKGMQQNFALYLSTDTVKEADRLFQALSEGGNIIVPIAKQFWNSYYGLCEDQFGIRWKISTPLD